MQPQAVQPLDYAPPAPRRPGLVGIWLTFQIAIGLAALAVITAALFVVPRFMMIFFDFKVQLPWTTCMVLDASRLISHGHGWIGVVLAAVALPWALAGMANTTERPSRTTRRIIYLLILLFVGLSVFVVVALYMPMVTLVQAVSGGPNR